MKQMEMILLISHDFSIVEIPTKFYQVHKPFFSVLFSFGWFVVALCFSSNQLLNGGFLSNCHLFLEQLNYAHASL